MKQRAAKNFDSQTKQLEQMRAEMDSLNREVCDLILARWRLAQRIAKLKQTMDLPLRDLPREKQMLRHLLRRPGLSHSEKGALEGVFKAIFRQTRKLQQEKLRSRS